MYAVVVPLIWSDTPRFPFLVAPWPISSSGNRQGTCGKLTPHWSMLSATISYCEGQAFLLLFRPIVMMDLVCQYLTLSQLQTHRAHP
jgi:hypothetical protein